MRFKTGKYAGKTLEEVLLKAPNFAHRYCRTYPDAPVGREFKRLFDVFDQKRYVALCMGCKMPANRALIFGSFRLIFLCHRCKPNMVLGRVAYIAQMYGNLLQHMDKIEGERWDNKRRMVRKLAEAKGLPARFGEKEALAFFVRSEIKIA
jgi:hypothetical protein